MIEILFVGLLSASLLQVTSELLKVGGPLKCGISTLSDWPKFRKKA